MPRNGSGTYSLPNNTFYPGVNGVTVQTADANTTHADIASALTGSLAADGQTPMTGDLDMGGNQIGSLGAAVALTGATNVNDVQSGRLNYLTGVAGTNTITASLSYLTAYTTGQEFTFIAANTNTGAVTIDVNSVGAKAITKQGTLPLSAGEILSGGEYKIQYDGTRFQLLNPAVYAPTACRGLTGANNAGTPTTQLDLAAVEVCLRDSTGTTITRRNTGTLTCNFSTAGPAANGRDQAGAFSANSWIYVYFIWNGTTLATLASTTTPASFTGATLPAGYTHWAFATAVRWNNSSNITTCYIRGSWVAIGRTNVLSSGSSLVDAAVSLSSVVPPIASNINIWMLLANGSAGAGQYSAFMNMTSGGMTVMTVSIGVNSASGFARDTEVSIVPNLSQQVFYRVDNANVGANIDVTGYQVANGDS